MTEETRKRNIEISAKIKGKLAERKVKQYKIAELLKLNGLTVSQKLNGVTSFTIGEFAIIATVYNFTPAEILDIVGQNFFASDINLKS